LKTSNLGAITWSGLFFGSICSTVASFSNSLSCSVIGLTTGSSYLSLTGSTGSCFGSSLAGVAVAAEVSFVASLVVSTVVAESLTVVSVAGLSVYVAAACLDGSTVEATSLVGSVIG